MLFLFKEALFGRDIDRSSWSSYSDYDEASAEIHDSFVLELAGVQPATVTPASPKSTLTFHTSYGPPACQTVLSEVMITVYFACYADLLQITGEVVEALYTKYSMTTTELCEMQTRVAQLHIKVEKWHSDLPESLQYNPERAGTFAERYRVKLALHYHSTKVLIGKPFLNFLRCYRREIPDSYAEQASSCVKAAHAILNLFPNKYDRTWLMELAPAWAILHFLLQATTVLIIQFSSSHNTQLPCPKLALEKSGRWLSGLSVYDSAARRAQGVCAMLLSRLSVILNCNEEP
ncbi:hypothetical protein EIK77_000335 [Talaromyces pinophilus]|nr:hypothetical protein EIK77_000335 [Talaromyces pinophilus]